MIFPIEKFAERLRPVSDEQGANASVAVLLSSVGGKLCVLLVERVKNASDPWSGQIALPGGKKEARDRSLRETVIRETSEETGIVLDGAWRFLGVLSAFKSIPKPEIKVLPFVNFNGQEPTVKLNKNELEEYYWVSIEELVANRRTVEFDFGKQPAFVLRGIVVWGMTYRILENLLCLLNA